MANNENKPNPFDPATLTNGLTKTLISMNLYGATFRDSCSNLEKKVETFFADTMGIKEADHVLIYPVVDQRGGNVCEIKMYIYFDTSIRDAKNIKPIGGMNVGGTNRKTLFDIVPGRSVEGEFEFSPLFTNTFAGIAVLDNENKMNVTKNPRYKHIAMLELDFFLTMALLLDIKDDDPYNFTVLAVDSTQDYRDGDTENAIILMMKYVDTARRRGRNKGKGRNIDYRAMDRDTIGKSRNGGGRRNY